MILLVVGDWGRLGAPAQIACADAMESTAAQLRSEVAAGAEGSYLGVVTTGDNFYEDGLRASSDAQVAASFSDVYQTNRTRPALFGLTWHGVVGNRDYHLSVAAQVDELPSARPEWDVMVSGYRAWGPGGGSGSAGGGGGGPPSSPPALGACFVDTTPWIHSYRDHVPKSHYASLVTLLAAHGGSWHAWEAEALEGLEACLRASDAAWRVVVGHHPIVSHQAHRGSEHALARVRELVERFGAAAYFNGHAHGLQHVAPASMPTTPGGGAEDDEVRHERRGEYRQGDGERDEAPGGVDVFPRRRAGIRRRESERAKAVHHAPRRAGGGSAVPRDARGVERAGVTRGARE